MEKYYRVIKDTFLWEEGAILKNSAINNTSYKPIEDIWAKVFDEKGECNEVISRHIIENNPTWFERVYPSQANKALFITADELKKFYKKFKK